MCVCVWGCLLPPISLIKVFGRNLLTAGDSQRHRGTQSPVSSQICLLTKQNHKAKQQTLSDSKALLWEILSGLNQRFISSM